MEATWELTVHLLNSDQSSRDDIGEPYVLPFENRIFGGSIYVRDLNVQVRNKNRLVAWAPQCNLYQKSRMALLRVKKQNPAERFIKLC